MQALPVDVMQEIVERKWKKVTIWLDKDKAYCSANYVRRLAAYTNVDVRFIVADEDPKEVPYEKLDSLLDM